MTSKRLLGWPLTVVLALITCILLYLGWRRHTGWKKDHVLLELRPIQTSKGWGYDILNDGKMFIHQDIIPAVPGGHGFRSKEDALAVGRVVYDRVRAGEMPMVTAAEIEKMGIRLDTGEVH
jgi:hypothetical protein